MSDSNRKEVILAIQALAIKLGIDIDTEDGQVNSDDLLLVLHEASKALLIKDALMEALTEAAKNKPAPPYQASYPEPWAKPIKTNPGGGYGGYGTGTVVYGGGPGAASTYTPHSHTHGAFTNITTA